jgi:hypothetical protein
MKRGILKTASCSVFVIWLVVITARTALAAQDPRSRTTLSDSSIKFTVPDKPYVVLRRGAIEAVIADNRAVDDAVLPGHRAGYHGVASLKHDKQQRSLFVPAYAGLNFEHIHDGTVQKREILFEPRNAPMQLRVIDQHTAELHQAPTPHWGLESCMRYQLIDQEVIELTFECVPRRAIYKNGYIGLFWASYIDQPESRATHFLIPGTDSADPPRWRPHGKWVRATSPEHGVRARPGFPIDARVQSVTAPLRRAVVLGHLSRHGLRASIPPAGQSSLQPIAIWWRQRQSGLGFSVVHSGIQNGRALPARNACAVHRL